MFRLNTFVILQDDIFTLKHSDKHQQGFLIAKWVSENSLFSKYGMLMAMLWPHSVVCYTNHCLCHLSC